MILHGVYNSKALMCETPVTVLTPTDYKKDGKYRSIYLLHGIFGGDYDFISYTLLPTYARDGDAIIIMPSVNRSFYSDQKNGQKYLTYVADELPEAMGSYFNLSEKREDTAVMGISMGGYGALKAALTRPERFGVCCSASACCLDLKEFLTRAGAPGGKQWARDQLGEQTYSDFCAVFGEKLKYNEREDVAFLAKQAANSQPKPKIFTVCGKSDYMYAQNAAYAEYLKTLELESTHVEVDGEHNWDYFNRALELMLGIFTEKGKENA